MRLNGRWLREPLLHFFLLGAVVLGLYQLVAPLPPTSRIVLTASDLQALRQEHQRRNGTAPTSEEEAALIQRYVDNEILYREALALGLDRGDIIVRRRLVQKMEFLNEDAGAASEPSDSELQAFLEAHADRYTQPARVSLVHVFVGSDQHNGQAAFVAARLREQLLSGADPTRLGDPFLRGQVFLSQTERDLAGIFGPGFASQIMIQPTGEWSQPISSSYGVHVVRVSEHQPARAPRLMDVRATVLSDWQEERRTAARRAELERLRGRYEVRIERNENERNN